DLTVFRPHNTVSSSATCGCKDGYSCCWQVGQSCFDSLNLMSNVRLYQRSIVWTVFLKCEVFPVKYFNVSVTSSDAMTSTTGAMTPTVSHVCPLSEPSVTIHRKHGVRFGMKNAVIPRELTTPPYEKGISFLKQISFNKKRVEKLSVPSNTTSTPSTNSSMFR